MTDVQKKTYSYPNKKGRLGGMEGKYNVLSAQIALAGMNRASLAETVGMHYNTLCRKMRGENSFTLEEALAIKTALNSKLPLEELFKRN